MTVKLRLMRMGKKKQPTYRVVVADSRSPRDGRFIEAVGTYQPRTGRPPSRSTTPGYWAGSPRARNRLRPYASCSSCRGRGSSSVDSPPSPSRSATSGPATPRLAKKAPGKKARAKVAATKATAAEAVSRVEWGEPGG